MLAGLVLLGSGALVACGPSGPQQGDLLVTSAASEGLPTTVESLMPDGARTIDVGVVDAVEVDGERVTAPARTALVAFHIADGSGFTPLGTDEATTFAIVRGGDRVEIDLDASPHGAAVIRGDGDDAQVSVGFDGREVRYDVGTGELARGSDPEFEPTTVAEQVSAADLTVAADLPDGLAFARGQVPVVPVESVTMRSTTWSPELGWAEPDGRWVTATVVVPQTFALARDDGSGPASGWDVDLELTSLALGSLGAELGEPTTTSAAREGTVWTGTAWVPWYVGRTPVDAVVRMTSDWGDVKDAPPSVAVEVRLTSEP